MVVRHGVPAMGVRVSFHNIPQPCQAKFDKYLTGQPNAIDCHLLEPATLAWDLADFPYQTYICYISRQT